MHHFSKSKYQYFIVSNYLKIQKPMPRVFMEVNINQKIKGRLVFELFENINPKTTENFRVLTAQQQYQNAKFNQIVPGLMIKGGFKENIQSIYGKNFPDESYSISHNKPGILSMVNNGPDTNNTQFFITLQAAEWLDKKNVAFGQLVDGFEVLQEIESLGLLNQQQGNKSGQFDAEISIGNCGELEPVIPKAQDDHSHH